MVGKRRNILCNSRLVSTAYRLKSLFLIRPLIIWIFVNLLILYKHWMERVKSHLIYDTYTSLPRCPTPQANLLLGSSRFSNSTHSHQYLWNSLSSPVSYIKPRRQTLVSVHRPSGQQAAWSQKTKWKSKQSWSQIERKTVVIDKSLPARVL